MMHIPSNALIRPAMWTSALLATLAAPLAAAPACPPRFAAYPAEARLSGPATAPRFTHAAEREFRTMIQRQVAGGRVDFAGAYSIAVWGCGTMCQRGAAVDRRSGAILFLPEARLGYDHRPGSRLLVVNRPSAIAEDLDARAKGIRSRYFVLERGALREMCK